MSCSALFCTARPACTPRLSYPFPCDPGEFSTQVGALIEQATSESLISTDWALNLQICDEVSYNYRCGLPFLWGTVIVMKGKDSKPRRSKLNMGKLYRIPVESRR